MRALASACALLTAAGTLGATARAEGDEPTLALLEADVGEAGGAGAGPGEVAMLRAAPLARGPSLARRLGEKLSLFGDELDHHLGALSFDLIDLRLDGIKRTARVRLGGGSASTLALRLRGDVVFDRGLARVDARLDLGLLGHRLQIALPHFEVVPRSFAGERYVELRLPLLEGRF